jgi:hypothetical protein
MEKSEVDLSLMESLRDNLFEIPVDRFAVAVNYSYKKQQAMKNKT